MSDLNYNLIHLYLPPSLDCASQDAFLAFHSKQMFNKYLINQEGREGNCWGEVSPWERILWAASYHRSPLKNYDWPTFVWYLSYAMLSLSYVFSPVIEIQMLLWSFISCLFMTEVDSTQTLSPDKVGDPMFLRIVIEQQGKGLDVSWCSHEINYRWISSIWGSLYWPFFLS